MKKVFCYYNGQDNNELKTLRKQELEFTAGSEKVVGSSWEKRESQEYGWQLITDNGIKLYVSEVTDSHQTTTRTYTDR